MKGSLEEGDSCFSYVRSYSWWPAQIVKIEVKKSKRRYSVVFIRTAETANLPEKEVCQVTDVTIANYMTKAASKRKFFTEAITELLRARRSAITKVIPVKFTPTGKKERF